MSEVVLAALERELTPQEWHRRFAQRPPTNLNVSAADWHRNAVCARGNWVEPLGDPRGYCNSLPADSLSTICKAVR